MTTLPKSQPVAFAVGERPSPLRGPDDARRLVSGLFDDRRESFMAIYLDTRHRPLAEPYIVSIGSLNASLVHPRETFRPAVELGAVALIVAHNHPSGDAKPSKDDLDLTARLAKAGDILGIALLDHVVFGHDESISLREYGWPTS